MRKLLLFLLLCPLGAMGQVFYQLPSPLPNATLRVCPVPSGGNPCPSPVSIFGDSGFTQPIVQPITLGPDGNFGFWTSAGQYTIEVSSPYNLTYIISIGGSGGSNVVTAASNYTSGDLVQAAGNNKTTSDSGVATANVVTAASAAGGANQVCTSSGASKTCSYIDFPEVLVIPSANCNNTTAGAGWSIGSGGTVTCRAGTNNKGGFVSITDTSTTFAQFSLVLPEDWDTATNPYIRVQVASTDVTSGHTIIPQIQVSCSNGDGSTTDDVTFNGAHSLSTITLNTTANQFWSSSNVQMNSTDMTGCVAGALMVVQVGRATDTATNAEFYSATVTVPRKLIVQAN